LHGNPSPRKVGIGAAGAAAAPVPLLEELRERLDSLADQVAELQVRNVAAAVVAGAGARPARPADALLSRDGSFNLSITEQTERPGGAHMGDGSLNFSLTEQSRKELSLSEQQQPAVSLGPVRAAQASRADHEELEPSISPSNLRSSDVEPSSPKVAKKPEPSRRDAPETMPSAKGKVDSLSSPLGDLPALDTRRRPGGDVLDSLIGIGSKAKGGIVLESLGGDPAIGRAAGGGDTLDALVGVSDTTGSGGRRRPAPLKLGEDDHAPLASVAEEEPIDGGEQSLESRHSSSGGHQKPTGVAAAKAASKAKSPPAAGVLASVESPADGSSEGTTPLGKSGLEASQSNLEVSQSGNEVSVYGDYSVEDSLELEKCDHVEAVKPNPDSPLRKASAMIDVGLTKVAASAAPSAKAITRGGGAGEPAKAVAAPVDALDALLKPKSEVSAPALDRQLSPKKASPKNSPKALQKSGSPEKGEAKEEEAYADESFEDDMSVPESIEEESMENGSDAWGNGEDV